MTICFQNIIKCAFLTSSKCENTKKGQFFNVFKLKNKKKLQNSPLTWKVIGRLIVGVPSKLTTGSLSENTSSMPHLAPCARNATAPPKSFYKVPEFSLHFVLYCSLIFFFKILGLKTRLKTGLLNARIFDQGPWPSFSESVRQFEMKFQQSMNEKRPFAGASLLRWLFMPEMMFKSRIALIVLLFVRHCNLQFIKCCHFSYDISSQEKIEHFRP